MKDVIVKDLIYLDLELCTQDEVFKMLAKELVKHGRAEDEEAIVDGFYQREKEFSTAMNDGIAIPHCRHAAIRDASVLIIRNKKLITWTQADEEVDLFFALMIPESNENQMHIKILAQVAQLIMEEDFINVVRNCTDSNLIFNEMASLNTLLK